MLAGSFLNVCIVRLPRGESIATPRSHCPHCGHVVRWYDNVPVQSFLLLLGRCRDCGVRISWQYPLVELGTAAWFAASVAGPARMLAAGNQDFDLLLRSLVHSSSTAALGFFLIGLMFMDWQTGLLPNEFTIGGLCVGLFLIATESFFLPSVRVKTFFTPEEVFIGAHAAAALAGYLLLRVLGALYRLARKQNGIGQGDAKQLAMLGAFLGFSQAGLALFIAVSIGGITGIMLLLGRRAKPDSALPFGTFLSVGGLCASLFGQPLLTWYESLFR